MNPPTPGSAIQCSMPTLFPITGRRSALKCIVIIVSSASGHFLKWIEGYCAYKSLPHHTRFQDSLGLYCFSRHRQPNALRRYDNWSPPPGLRSLRPHLNLSITFQHNDISIAWEMLPVLETQRNDFSLSQLSGRYEADR